MWGRLKLMGKKATTLRVPSNFQNRRRKIHVSNYEPTVESRQKDANGLHVRNYRLAFAFYTHHYLHISNPYRTVLQTLSTAVERRDHRCGQLLFSWLIMVILIANLRLLMTEKARRIDFNGGRWAPDEVQVKGCRCRLPWRRHRRLPWQTTRQCPDWDVVRSDATSFPSSHSFALVPKIDSPQQVCVLETPDGNFDELRSNNRHC